MLLWSTAHKLERFYNQKRFSITQTLLNLSGKMCLRNNETIVLCRNHQEERKERQWHRWNVSKPPLWWLRWRSCTVNKRRSVRAVNWSQQWETEPNFVESQESKSPQCAHCACARNSKIIRHQANSNVLRCFNKRCNHTHTGFYQQVIYTRNG